jgi:large subunit ribosomal protein L17
MRHRVVGKRLGRSTTHRRAMRRNFICSVIKHERVVTTLERAKAMRRSVEKMITLGKQKDLARIRRAMALLGDKQVVRKLFDELGPRYKDRPGGYTRTLRLSGYRIGDGGSKAIFELVDNSVLENELAQAAAES